VEIKRYYAGIGSRETPAAFQALMGRIAHFLYDKGYTLRSGGATGADTAFEVGVRDDSMKEIYLPWKRFNNHPSQLYKVSEEAMWLGAAVHPAWDNLSLNGKLLIARDGYQVLGLDLKTPSDFVICWTEGGRMKGGTAQEE